MRNPPQSAAPKTQSAASGAPPRPPKKAAPGLEGDSSGGSEIEIPDPVVLEELAQALSLKPFHIKAGAMGFDLFLRQGDAIPFEVASEIAKKHGFIAHKRNGGRA